MENLTFDLPIEFIPNVDDNGIIYRSNTGRLYIAVKIMGQVTDHLQLEWQDTEKSFKVHPSYSLSKFYEIPEGLLGQLRTKYIEEIENAHRIAREHDISTKKKELKHIESRAEKLRREISSLEEQNV